MKAKSNEWLCGYAAALGAARRRYYDDTLVEQVMIGDGITLLALVEAGAEMFDTREILKAVSSGSDNHKLARGAGLRRLRRLLKDDGRDELGVLTRR